MKKKQSPDLLMTVFDFTPEDLAANMEGHITVRQVPRLRIQTSTIVAPYWIRTGVLIISMMALVGLAGRITQEVLPIVLFFGLILAGSFMGLIFHEGRIGKDIGEGIADNICGMVILEQKPSGSNRMIYFVYCRDQKFKVLSKEFLAFENGGKYCIYYAPRSKVILSVRPLLEADENIEKADD